MSDGTTQTDAEVIARAQQRYADLRAITTLRMASPEETALLVRVASTGADLIAAQMRTIDALTAERDAARAELATLREACAGAPAMMADMLGFLRAETGWMRVSYDKYAKQIAAKADAIRAALGDADYTSMWSGHIAHGPGTRRGFRYRSAATTSRPRGVFGMVLALQSRIIQVGVSDLRRRICP